MTGEQEKKQTAPDQVADAGASSEEVSSSGAAVAELETLKAEVEKLRYDLLLQRADLDNTRKRIERQKEEDVKYAALPMARELVTVLDTLEIALTHATADDPMRQGVGMVFDSFLKTLEQFNVRRIEAAGQPFDPKLHEAMGVLTDPSKPDDTVVSVQRPGYIYFDRLVRPAGVLINRLPHPAEAPADGNPKPE